MNDEIQYIQLAIKYADLVKTTLGPKGRNKLVKFDSNLLVTNDGATIMKSIKTENPIGDLFKRLAVSQEQIAGDGTTTAIVLAGSLLQNAMDLIKKGMHPSNIINGYNLAKIASLNILEELKFEGELDQIIQTCLGSKVSQEIREKIIEVLKSAQIDYQKLRIHKQDNQKNNVELINGYGLNAFVRNERMPSETKGKTCLLDFKVNLKTTEQYNLKDADELEKLEDKEKKFAKQIVNNLKKADIKCVFYTDTSREFEAYLTNEGISGILLRKKDDIDNISLVLNKRAIPDNKVDFAQYAAEAEMQSNKGSVKLSSKNSQIKTLIISGQTLQILEEIQRALEDVVTILKHGNEVVVGAGAIEMQIAKKIREIEVKGKDQISFHKFANSLEAIPMQIAENCGMDSWQLITELRALHKTNQNIGIDVNNKLGYSDAKSRGIVEPVMVKIYAIANAVDVVNLILKLDTILVGEEKEKKDKI